VALDISSKQFYVYVKEELKETASFDLPNSNLSY